MIMNVSVRVVLVVVGVLLAPGAVAQAQSGGLVGFFVDNEPVEWVNRGEEVTVRAVFTADGTEMQAVREYAWYPWTSSTPRENRSEGNGSTRDTVTVRGEGGLYGWEEVLHVPVDASVGQDGNGTLAYGLFTTEGGALAFGTLNVSRNLYPANVTSRPSGEASSRGVPWPGVLGVVVVLLAAGARPAGLGRYGGGLASAKALPPGWTGAKGDRVVTCPRGHEVRVDAVRIAKASNEEQWCNECRLADARAVTRGSLTWDRDPATYAAYRTQWEDVRHRQALELARAFEVDRALVSCGECGGKASMVGTPTAYRCFHCGVVFCSTCSSKHFGTAMQIDEATGTMKAPAMGGAHER